MQYSLCLNLSHFVCVQYPLCFNQYSLCLNFSHGNAILTLSCLSCCSSCPTLPSPSGPACPAAPCCSRPRTPRWTWWPSWTPWWPRWWVRRTWWCRQMWQINGFRHSGNCSDFMLCQIWPKKKVVHLHLCLAQYLLVEPIHLLEVVVGQSLVDLLWKALSCLLECGLQRHFGICK